MIDARFNTGSQTIFLPLFTYFIKKNGVFLNLKFITLDIKNFGRLFIYKTSFFASLHFFTYTYLTNCETVGLPEVINRLLL